jgi:CheY-like chemotaxis protein
VARTILVVDDEPDLVATCQRFLGRVDPVSRRAHTGPDAMAVVHRERPDLVVADLQRASLLGPSDGAAEGSRGRAAR